VATTGVPRAVEEDRVAVTYTVVVRGLPVDVIRAVVEVMRAVVRAVVVGSGTMTTVPPPVGRRLLHPPPQPPPRCCRASIFAPETPRESNEKTIKNFILAAKTLDDVGNGKFSTAERVGESKQRVESPGNAVLSLYTLARLISPTRSQTRLTDRSNMSSVCLQIGSISGESSGSRNQRGPPAVTL